MKKIKIVLLVLLFVTSIGASYAYMMTTFKTNELTIKVGIQDEGMGTLTPNRTGFVLIPMDAIVTNQYEVKVLEYTLIVNSNASGYYRISHNLPEQFNLTHNNSENSFMLGRGYTITISMNAPVDIDQVFWINVELI